MTELREENAASASPAAGGNKDDAEALHHLYRMSRTAGLGSGDYVAINNTAIVSLLLGCTSVLSLIYPLMLIVAAAALVCGIIALVQIRTSNGTQTGRTFAAFGILLALALGGVSAYRMAMEYVQKRNDSHAIGKVVDQLSDLIVARQYSQAYNALFSDSFHTAFSEQKFADAWEPLVQRFGAIQKIDWGHQAEFDVIRGTETRRGIIISTVKFEKYPDPARQPMAFILKDGQWLIDDFSQLFPKPTAKGAQGQGGGSGAPQQQGQPFFGGNDQPDGSTPPG
jgi:hypothetical protein